MEISSLRSKQPKMSLEEFYALSEGPPYYEFEYGELIEINRPTPRHQRVLLKLAIVIEEHISMYGLGRLYPIEYHLAESGRYEVTACVETGQVFCPGVFEGLEIDLAALMGDEPD